MKSQKRHLHRKSASTEVADELTYAVAIIEPLITIPQVTTIFLNKTAAGVSLVTWVGYDVLTFVWLWYAVVHKDKLVFIYQGLFLIIQTGVIIGGLLYGAKW